jgi:hypothetical protein
MHIAFGTDTVAVPVAAELPLLVVDLPPRSTIAVRVVAMLSRSMDTA